MRALPASKCRRNCPSCLSIAEVQQFFSYVGILKHRAALMLCYGSGLRSSEAVALKITDIDSSRMLIRVQQGKGAKDRFTVLSGRLLTLLRRYYKIQRPVEWLFPGTKQGTHLQAATIQDVCRDAARMAGFHKRVTPHVLRSASAYYTTFQSSFILKTIGLGRAGSAAVYGRRAGPLSLEPALLVATNPFSR